LRAVARAFVTGGSGFLGGVLIAALRARGDEVVALARSADAVRAVEKRGASDVCRGDLSEPGRLAAGMKGCEVVHHCAGWVKPAGKLEEARAINAQGTQHMLDAARRAGVARFVYVSTEAVLMAGRPLVRVDESVPYPEHPLGPYAASKGEAERNVRRAAAEGLHACIVRPRAIWGRGDTVALPRMCEAVRQGRFMWIGGGLHLTSTCHVDNVVEGMLLAAERGGRGEVYFLSDGEPLVFKHWVTDMLATQGLQAPDRSLPFAAAVALGWTVERAWALLGRGEPPISQSVVALIGQECTVRDDKARRELGYQGKVTIPEGMTGLRHAARDAG
jgi:nucleoside-diphosphate-sugar epimerase